MERISVLYLLLFTTAFILETLFFKFHYFLTRTHYKIHHYSFSRYLFLLLFPVLGLFFSIKRSGTDVISVFISFAFLGTFLEWLVGWAYHNIIGQRLWTYHRYAITKYTSLLSIPLWGFCGVLFWGLTKRFF